MRTTHSAEPGTSGGHGGGELTPPLRGCWCSSIGACGCGRAGGYAGWCRSSNSRHPHWVLHVERVFSQRGTADRELAGTGLALAGLCVAREYGQAPIVRLDGGRKTHAKARGIWSTHARRKTCFIGDIPILAPQECQARRAKQRSVVSALHGQTRREDD